ncbi:MAG: hypothetical protein HC899_21130 [Leptolyngbyaceae cyanobacterium SM1_4_3]|nr:hypothetical protein [Leptolyngbyaceae cyanobacterium SM1_4_3]
MVNQSGYPLEVKPYEAWRNHLIQVAQSQGNALYPYLPRFMTNPGSVEKDSSAPQPTTQFDCQQTLQALAETSITCPPVNAQLLQTYFAYFVQSGFLNVPSHVHPEPGVKQ